MSDSVRRFTQAGIGEFARVLKSIRLDENRRVPDDLLVDPTFATPLGKTELLHRRDFADRYDFGAHLGQLLSSFKAREISYDRGLWAWLAAWYFDLLCPTEVSGSRKLREDNAYIPSLPRRYYRHLVRTPWYLFNTHGETATYLLTSPLNEQSYLLDQLAARQFIISSQTLIAAAKALYTQPGTGKPRRGAGAKGPGSARRFAIVANQLLLTFDIHRMPVDKFIALLPAEFHQ